MRYLFPLAHTWCERGFTTFLPEEEHEANSINNATMYFADFNVIKVATFCGNAYKEKTLVFFLATNLKIHDQTKIDGSQRKNLGCFLGVVEVVRIGAHVLKIG